MRLGAFLLFLLVLSAIIECPVVWSCSVKSEPTVATAQPIRATMQTRRATADLQGLLEAGQCEDFEQSPLMCQYALIGAWKSVWTAPSLGLTQEYWQAQMHGSVQSSDDTFLSFLDVISSLPYDGCAQAYAKLICPTFFPPCIRNPDTASNRVVKVLPVPVCRSVCEAANDACRSFRHGADLVDCANTISPLTGGSQWPEDNLECTTNSAIIFLKQTADDEDEEEEHRRSQPQQQDPAGVQPPPHRPPPPLSHPPQHDQPPGRPTINTSLPKDTTDTNPYGLEFACPPPMIFYPEIPDQYTGLACSTTCKQKMYLIAGKDGYNAYYTGTSVLFWISFVCLTILLITLMIFPTQRQFPTIVVLFIGVALWIFSVGPVGATFIGTDFACKSKTELQYGVSYCGFYAWAFFFGGLSTVLWWTYLSFIIFYNVNNNGLIYSRRSLDEKMFVPMCIFCWVYPFVASLLVAFLPSPNDSGTVGLFSWCWIATNHTVAHENLIWGLFFPWVFLGAVLVVVFTTISLFRICFQGQKSLISTHSVLQFSLLMAIFCFYFFLTMVVAIFGEFYFTQDTSTKSELVAWHECIFSGRIATFDCPRPANDPAPLYWLEGMTYAGCGTVLFICFFILRESSWRCWYIALSNLWQGRDFYDGLRIDDNPLDRQFSGGGSGGSSYIPDT